LSSSGSVTFLFPSKRNSLQAHRLVTKQSVAYYEKQNPILEFIRPWCMYEVLAEQTHFGVPKQPK